jgi:hypothetical protein
LSETAAPKAHSDNNSTLFVADKSAMCKVRGSKFLDLPAEIRIKMIATEAREFSMATSSSPRICLVLIFTLWDALTPTRQLVLCTLTLDRIRLASGTGRRL